MGAFRSERARIITIVGLKRPKAECAHMQPDILVEAGDLQIVSGPTQLAQKFVALT